MTMRKIQNIFCTVDVPLHQCFSSSVLLHCNAIRKSWAGFKTFLFFISAIYSTSQKKFRVSGRFLFPRSFLLPIFHSPFLFLHSVRQVVQFYSSTHFFHITFLLWGPLFTGKGEINSIFSMHSHSGRVPCSCQVWVRRLRGEYKRKIKLHEFSVL